MSTKFGRHKRAMGFGEVHICHTFRSTFITRMMHPEADSTLAKKLVGHKIKDITLGTYAGDADWEKKLGLMELVKYSREAA